MGAALGAGGMSECDEGSYCPCGVPFWGAGECPGDTSAEALKGQWSREVEEVQQLVGGAGCEPPVAWRRGDSGQSLDMCWLPGRPLPQERQEGVRAAARCSHRLWPGI